MKKADTPQASARNAKLNYVTDGTPGIRRCRAGKGFSYISARGRVLRESSALQRIQSLAIPPAWTDVWICSSANGHLQATGRDARGRKQFRYHRRWREARDTNKFQRMISFAKALPGIRRHIRREIRQPGLGREKVLAAVLRLLDLTGVRPGNEEYADQNHSYGLTTLRNRHAQVRGDHLQLNFCGKGGKQQVVEIEHPILSRIVRKCQELPGQLLFQYLDENGKRHRVTSGDVNDYLAKITGQDFTAKDFRTWAGTVTAVRAFQSCNPNRSQRRTNSEVVRAIKQVAERLGNTPAVCRKYYIHPAVVDSYLAGTLPPAPIPNGQPARKIRGQLDSEETVTLATIRRMDNESLTSALAASLKEHRRSGPRNGQAVM